MKRRIIRSILVAFFLMILCAFSVSAEEYGDLEYKIESGKVTITGCTYGLSGDIVIPSKINGKPVTKIGSWAFNGADIESVTIPSSVKSIDNYAFNFCDRLTTVVLNKGLKTIGNGAFSGCKKLESITIPSSVTSIGSGAFDGCEKLESITIPSSVTSIGDHTFKDCSSLKTVVLNKGLKTIGNKAFYGCDSLESLPLPSSVTSIGNYAFYDCGNLKSIAIPSGVTAIDKYTFAYCDNLTKIYISESVTSINKDAFGLSSFSSTYTGTIYYEGSSSQLEEISEADLSGATIKGNHTHNLKTKITKATTKKDGKIVQSCSCGAGTITTKISKAKSFKLSATEYTYNGKERKPAVTVTDATGKKLEKGKDYTVTYSSGRKKVGTYKVTIELKGNYSGKKTLTYTIKPTTKDSISLLTGETAKIGAKSNTTIKYKTSNKSVATVSSKGVITAKKAGKATITVTSGKISQKITVKVSKPSIKITASKSSIDVGSKLKFTATVKPSNAKIKWSVSDTKLATISSKGVLTAKKVGTVTVTASITRGGKTYKSSYKVTIKYDHPDVVVYISHDLEYTNLYAVSIENNGNASLKVLASGYVSCNGHHENIKQLYDDNLCSSTIIKAGEDETIVAILDNKMWFYSSEYSYLYLYVEYKGETYRLDCYTGRYGMQKCTQTVRIS